MQTDDGLVTGMLHRQFQRQFLRGIRTLRRNAKAQASQSQIPVPTIDVLRSQLANLPLEQREYLQNLLSTREDEVAELLKAQQTVQKEQKDDKPQESEIDYVFSLVTETLETAETLSDFGAVFWQAVKTLAETKDPKYIELFSTLFEVAKRMPENIRIDAIYLVGTYLYRLKKVRLDPVNEVEYLDSLVAKGRPFRALEYWNSRKTRDEVRDSVYWTEIGALYHLDAGLWHKAEELASSLHEDGVLSPRLAGEMVKFAAKRKLAALNAWTERFVSSLKGHVATDPAEVKSLTEILNRVTPVTPENVAQVLYQLIENRQWSSAAKVVGNSATEYDKERLLDAMHRTTKYTSKPEPSILDFVELLTEDSGLLFQERFWAAWLCSLARTGEQGQILDVLDHLTKFEVPLSSESAARLVYTLLKRGHVTVAEAVAHKYENEPLVSAVLLRYYAENDATKVEPFISQLKCRISAPLAASILEAGNPTNIAVSDLGLDNYCWRLIWAAARDNKLETECRELFGQMLAIGNFKATMGLVETVAQAFICAGQDIVGAAAAVTYFDKYLGFTINPLLAASIFQLVSRIMQGRPVLFSRIGRNEAPVNFGELKLGPFLAQLSRKAKQKLTEPDFETLFSNWESARTRS